MLQNPRRNDFQAEGWSISKFPAGQILDGFDCGDADLNDYFHKDRLLYLSHLLTQTYFMSESIAPDFIVGLVDFCNDAVRKEKFKVKAPYIPEELFHQTLPAVKITRLGINKSFQNRNLGSHLMNMIKRFFLSDNRTGCRFMTVDAYNNEKVLNFYTKNGFQFFTEKDLKHQTRAMFFDLLRLQGMT